MIVHSVVVLNVDGNFDFTGSNNNATALYVNPVLTGNSLNDFMAIWAVKGGAFFNTSTPAPSAILQADSTTQGSLPFPRMTETQKNAISSPAIGLHVYQTDGTEGVYVYKSSGWTFAY